MKNIIYITAPEILAVPIEECDEPLIDVKDSGELLYGPPPDTELTAYDYTKVRKTVFEKLCKAQQELPIGWRFRIYEGYRSLKVQQLFFDNVYQQTLLRYPNANKQELFNQTTRLVSPTINYDGSENIPAHNTGGAVDIEILTETGELLDMGMAAKDWCMVEPDLCMTECDLISKGVQKNRYLLLELMQAYGFVNYPSEWWHFSYGDRYWAYHQKMPNAIYHSADKVKK